MRRHTGDVEGVLTIDFFNPFNYLLSRVSPTGGFSTAVFSPSKIPSDERLFGNAPVIHTSGGNSVLDSIPPSERGLVFNTLNQSGDLALPGAQVRRASRLGT